jgi:hypothetical protein
LKNKEKRSVTYRPKGNSDEGNASVATTTDISDCSEVLLAFAGCANNGDDGTQYYGYPKTTITSDFHSYNGLWGIFGGFLDLFSCRKTTTKSSGIPGFIFVN